jgi:23S rRNA (guanosine2251-2'-O)-methyltransferase
VRELLLSGRKVQEVLVEIGLRDRAILDDIIDLARESKVPVRDVSPGKLRSVAKTDAPQGVVARATPLREFELEDLLGGRSRKPAPFLVAFDGVTDPGNLGAALRSAECMGVTGVVLPRHRGAHITPTVAKAAAGAIEHLPMALVGGMPSALEQLRSLGVWVVGLDEGGDVPIDELRLADEPVVLVLGAEGAGLSRLVRSRCDVLARIPLGGKLASLNVATAATVACYEVRRLRRQR